MFLLKEFLKSFIYSKKIRVGFALCVLPTPYYGKIMASARLRAYDVINNFSPDHDYFLELYKPWKKYDLVIFQKYFDQGAAKLAQKLKKKGVKIILDINVNFYDQSALRVQEAFLREQVLIFSQIADAIITSTNYLAEYVSRIFPQKPVVCIPENITDNFFQVQKQTKTSQDSLKLMYVGYAVKAKEVLLIKDILKELRKKYAFKLLFICEKNPQILIEGIESEFIKYRQKIIHRQMQGGDIFINPRNTSNTYNLGHSFTKIGYPMSVGIPVITNVIPSYEGSPALLCQSGQDWKAGLERMLSDTDFRTDLARKGINYCRENFSRQVVKRMYLDFFDILQKS